MSRAAIQLFVCQECVVHILLIFKQKLSISLTSAATLSFTRFLPYLLEHVGQIVLPRGIWPGQMQRLTARIKVILFRGRIILASKQEKTLLWALSITDQYLGISEALLHPLTYYTARWVYWSNDQMCCLFIMVAMMKCWHCTFVHTAIILCLCI